MASIHVISDLFLGFNERATEEHVIPDADLVIVNGNIGHAKRAMLYLETLCSIYPNTQFVYNLGYTEKYKVTGGKWDNEAEFSEKIRAALNEKYPKNLHFPLNENKIITTRNNEFLDILCVFGFPKIHSFVGDWENTWYYKHISMGITTDYHHPLFKKPAGTSEVDHGHIPLMATVDYVNTQHENETNLIKKWELTPTHKKVLVTHINPYADERNYNLKINPHLIHLNEGLWVTGNTAVSKVNFLGAKLISNPGKGLQPRSHIVVF
jgi:hypothetical protein